MTNHNLIDIETRNSFRYTKREFALVCRKFPLIVLLGGYIMSKAKKYYWLKLKSDFFDDETIKFIEEQENGIKYSNFYLKLCLKSLKTNGKLIRLIGETLIPYDINSLSKLTGVDFDTVRSAMQLFEHIGLIKVLESGEIYLSQIDELIGSETDKAELMRRLRAERKIESNNVTKMLPYIEKEIDIEKDKDVDVKEITKCYEENIGLITPATAELLFDYLKEMDKELIIKAIKIASINNKRNGRYINGILNDWSKKGFKNILDVENEQNEFKNKTQKKQETLEEKVERYKREWGIEDED